MCRSNRSRPSDTPRVVATVAAGLDRVASLTPGHGWLDLVAGVSTVDGAFARGEVGVKPTNWLDAFAFGEVRARPGSPVEGLAGVGARARF